jgi:ABC-type transport system involved in cytochrome c biogenesis permease subunit
VRTLFEWSAKIGVVCFSASYALGLLHDVGRIFWPRLAWWPTPAVAAAGLFAQTLFLVHRGLEQGRLPTATAFDSLLWLSWFAAAAYLYLAVGHRTQQTGLFLLPAALGFALFAGLAFERQSASGLQAKIVGYVHGLALLAGSGLVALAMAGAAMYLVKVHQLRARAFLDRLRLPSLEWIETVMGRSIQAAWPLLTIGIGLGFALRGLAWHDPKIAATLVAWAAISALAWYRRGAEHRGVRTAWAVLAAGAVVLVAVLGDPLFATSHQAPPGPTP